MKETEEGVRKMCKDMEEIYSEGMEKGIEKGMEKGEYIGAEKKAKEVAQSWIAESIMPAK